VAHKLCIDPIHSATEERHFEQIGSGHLDFSFLFVVLIGRLNDFAMRLIFCSFSRLLGHGQLQALMILPVQ
jgi:hypothetical protein